MSVKTRDKGFLIVKYKILKMNAKCVRKVTTQTLPKKIVFKILSTVKNMICSKERVRNAMITSYFKD